jgi:hypothetical protein
MHRERHIGIARDAAEDAHMSTSNPVNSATTERAAIASVPLKIRLVLVAILIAGVLAVIVPP